MPNMHHNNNKNGNYTMSTTLIERCIENNCEDAYEVTAATTITIGQIPRDHG